MMFEHIFAAFLIGLFGSGHCFAMCGGIAGSLSVQSKRPSLVTLCFNAGRLTTYTSLGALVFFFQHFAFDALSGYAPYFVMVSGGLLLLIALYIGQWVSWITSLEKIGLPIWKQIKPLTRTLFPVDTPAKATLLGMTWGFLPCGLIYSTLTWSLTLGHEVPAYLLMLAFGLGTFPSMLSVGFFARQSKNWLGNQHVRKAGAYLLLLMGLWSIGMGAFHLAQHSHPSASMPSHHSHSHH